MFKRILVPTDGSEQAERAALAGIALAREMDAEVIGLTVIPKFHTFTYKTDMLEDTQAQFAAQSEQSATRNLGVVVAAARTQGVPCTTETAVSDEPFQTIVATARDRDCDLIVMGSHGRGGAASVLLGSETQKVLVHTSVPVLVYR